MVIMRDFIIGARRVSALAQAIEDLPERVDAIVSPDDNLLSHGGDVSRAIWDAGGPTLATFVDTHRTALTLGSLFITPAGNLRADHLVHAVTIDFDTNRRARPRDLQDLYAKLFQTADKRGWASLALPLLGSGAEGVAVADAVRHFVYALQGCSPDRPRRVLLCLHPDHYATCLSMLHHASERSGSPAQKGLARGKFLAALRLAASGAGGALPDCPDPGPQVEATRAAAVLSVFEMRLDVLLQVAFALLPPTCASSWRDSLRQHPPAGGEASRTSLGGRWRLVAEAMHRSGRAIPPATRASMEEAIAARNLIVHQGASPEAVQSLIQGLQLLEVLIQDLEPVRTIRLPGPPFPSAQAETAPPRAMQRPPLPSRVPAAPPPASAPPQAAGPTVVAPEPHGTRPVRELKRFLKETMAVEDLEEMLSLRQKEGYKGDLDSILLELCVQSRDLVSLLTEHATATRLRRELLTRGQEPGPGDDHQKLAEDLLDYLGFPRKRDLLGLNLLRERFTLARHAITHEIPTVIRGHVNRCGPDLEWCLKIFARFLIQWAFRSRKPDPFLVERGWMGSYCHLDRLPMGKLMEILSRMDAEIRKSPNFSELRKDIGSDPLLPAYLERLVELRNLFSHDKRGPNQQERLPDRDVPERGKEFLDLACRLMEYLGRPDGRAFPFVVRIESITTDNYGRRLVRATSDGEPGKVEEIIFTSADLRPGELYLMRPLSNPWRVDPVLVALGDTANPDAG
jgi:O-acetyl-ADP-ribose deacetylase (regulator of RNase III)